MLFYAFLCTCINGWLGIKVLSKVFQGIGAVGERELCAVERR